MRRSELLFFLLVLVDLDFALYSTSNARSMSFTMMLLSAAWIAALPCSFCRSDREVSVSRDRSVALPHKQILHISWNRIRCADSVSVGLLDCVFDNSVERLLYLAASSRTAEREERKVSVFCFENGSYDFQCLVWQKNVRRRLEGVNQSVRKGHTGQSWVRCTGRDSIRGTTTGHCTRMASQALRVLRCSWPHGLLRHLQSVCSVLRLVVTVSALDRCLRQGSVVLAFVLECRDLFNDLLALGDRFLIARSVDSFVDVIDNFGLVELATDSDHAGSWGLTSITGQREREVSYAKEFGSLVLYEAAAHVRDRWTLN